MKYKIELPVGTRFKIKADDRAILLEVVESNDCGNCFFYAGILRGPCCCLECAGAFRTDSTPVIFKKTENN